MKLSIASLGAEPGSRFLDQVKLAELLGFHAFFHNDKKWARDVFSRLGAATQCTTTTRARHQRGRSLHAPCRAAGAGRRDARRDGAGALPRDHGIGQPLRDAARLWQPQAGGRAARGRRPDAAVVARREGHDRRRGGEVQGRRARLEADRDPAALHRQPRAANPQARRRRSPTAC